MASYNKVSFFFLSMLIGLSLVIGGASLAIFTDNKSNANNTFATGTIKLVQERSSGDSIKGPMFYNSKSDPNGAFPYDQSTPYAPPGGEAIGGWAPGDSATRSLNLSNVGTLDAKVTKVKAQVNSNGEGITEGKAFENFVKYMNIEVRFQNRVIYKGSLEHLLDDYVDLKPLILKANGGEANLTFTATLNKKAGNDIKGKTFIFDFTLFAEQLKNNP